jgi:phosphate transport system substrate-binding protein
MKRDLSALLQLRFFPQSLLLLLPWFQSAGHWVLRPWSRSTDRARSIRSPRRLPRISSAPNCTRCTSISAFREPAPDSKFCRGETDISNASQADPEKGNGRVRQSRHPLLRNAHRLRCADRGGQSAECFVSSLSVADLRKLWEPGGTGPDQYLEGHQPGVARPEDQALCAGRRFGQLRVLHRSRCWYCQVQPHRRQYRRRPRRAGAAHRRRQGRPGLYLSLDYYVENQKQLKAVAISDGKEAVLPTVDNIRNGSYQPLSRPLFLYVSEKSLEKPAVKDFVDFGMKNAARLVVEANYLPLPTRAYSENLERIAAKRSAAFMAARTRPARVPRTCGSCSRP